MQGLARKGRAIIVSWERECKELRIFAKWRALIIGYSFEIICLISGSIIIQLFHFNCHPLTWSRRCFRHNYLYSLHMKRIMAFMHAGEVLQFITCTFGLLQGNLHFSRSFNLQNPLFRNQQTDPILAENSLLSPEAHCDPKGHAANSKGMQKAVEYFTLQFFRWQVSISFWGIFFIGKQTENSSTNGNECTAR